MIARTMLRRVQTIAYSANNTVTSRIDVTGRVRRLFLELKGSATVAANAGNVETQNPGTLIPSMQLFLNHSDVLKQGRWLDWIDRGYVLEKLPAETAVAAAAASYAVASRIEWPFITPLAARPIDTVLEIGQNDRLDIQITWGDVTSLGDGGITWATEPTIDVIAEITNDPNLPPAVALYKESAFEDSVGTSANANYQGLTMVTGPGLNYHHLIIVCEDDHADTGRAKISNITDLTLQQTGQGVVSNPVGIISGLETQHDFNTNMVKVNAVRTGVYPILFQPQYEGRMTYNLVTADLDDLRFVINQALFPTAGYNRVLQGSVEPFEG